MIDLPTLIITTLELSSQFLKNITRDKNVQEAYKNLITALEKRDVIPPAFRDRLARYQVERDELLPLLKEYKGAISDDPEVLAIVQKLVSALELAAEQMHNVDLQRMQLAYKYHLGEQKIWSRFGIAVAFLGFFLIFAGIASIYLVNITIGIVVTVAGIAVNLTSALFFRQASNATAQADNKYEKLTMLENIRLSAEVLSSLKTSLSSLAN